MSGISLTFGRISERKGRIWDEIQFLDKKLELEGVLDSSLAEKRSFGNGCFVEKRRNPMD